MSLDILGGGASAPSSRRLEVVQMINAPDGTTVTYVWGYQPPGQQEAIQRFGLTFATADVDEAKVLEAGALLQTTADKIDAIYAAVKPKPSNLLVPTFGMARKVH